MQVERSTTPRCTHSFDHFVPFFLNMIPVPLVSITGLSDGSENLMNTLPQNSWTPQKSVQPFMYRSSRSNVLFLENRNSGIKAFLSPHVTRHSRGNSPAIIHIAAPIGSLRHPVPSLLPMRTQESYSFSTFVNYDYWETGTGRRKP
jgi:hypothetical protein